MASQGQRFRRRALRRGYKVDEVDAFLDRVEATLAGEPVGAPVGAQEVHDVVFRVRFGGYDEWQVDLHLDRVERQLGRAGGARAAPGPRPRPHGSAHARRRPTAWARRWARPTGWVRRCAADDRMGPADGPARPDGSARPHGSA